jgi:hypothetical protein
MANYFEDSYNWQNTIAGFLSVNKIKNPAFAGLSKNI